MMFAMIRSDQVPEMAGIKHSPNVGCPQYYTNLFKTQKSKIMDSGLIKQ